ncbi:MAG: hypothetical protein RBQ97_08875, partial [Acholeplasma sp.]|nr:hypothetical protein [Acholeplasma sp.]
NVRISILALKSIMTIKSIDNIEGLKSISFKSFPEEMGLLEDDVENGYDLYYWARREERKVCDYIDSLSDEKPNFSLIYNNLFLITLFEPNNVLYNNTTFLYYTLIIFDDMQKLTPHQRKLLIDCFYTMRPNVGIWIGERLEALSPIEIISSDGSEGREYREFELEEFWRERRDALYKKVLVNIADRRVKLSYNDAIGSFSNCIEDSIDTNDYSQKLENYTEIIRSKILNTSYLCKQFLPIIEYIDQKNEDLYKRALYYQLLDIKYRRDSKGQIKMNFTGASFLEEYKRFSKDANNKTAAEFYLCNNLRIPYYYGIDRLKEISSFNIEQFLAFSGSIFEKCIASSIIQIGNKSNYIINATEQEKYIREVSNKRWDDIVQRFHHGDKMQNLLRNYCVLAQKTRDSGTNPYSGGAITGIAILYEDIEILKSESNEMLLKVLCDCISSNYLEKRKQNHGGKTWIVLYFNRWLCVKFNLPLKYGGWRKVKISQLNSSMYDKDIFDNDDAFDDEQVNMFDINNYRL